MAGLKLQVLSNPSPAPSFVIGNPQRSGKRSKKRGIALQAEARENKNQRSEPVSKHRRRKNPFVAVARKGKHKVRVGAALTPGERKEAAKKALGLRKQLKSSAIGPELKAKGKKRLRALQAQIGAGKSHFQRVRKKIKRYKARGYKISSPKVSIEAAANFTRKRRKARKSGGKKYGIIGQKNGFLLIRRKDGTIKKVKMKKRKGKKAAKSAPKRRRRKHAKKAAAAPKRRRKAKKAAPKRRRRKHAKKAAAPKRRRRKHSRKHASAPKKHRRKAKRSGKRRSKRRSSKKYWAGRHHARHAHVGLGMKKGGKRRGTIRRGKKKYHYSVHRKNPQGGTMGKALDFLTAGDPKEAGFILAASALSEPLAALALKVPGFGAGLAALNNAISGVSPRAAGAIVPILPNVLVAIAAEMAGKKLGKKSVQDFGKALMITNIVDLGEAIGATLSSAVGLSGVSYVAQPGMRGRKGMRGVDFTMGAVPRGVGAVPRGVAGVPHGLHGLTRMDNADFGGESLMTPAGMTSTAADFGGVDFTSMGRQMADFGRRHLGAVPGMRGAHTGDVQYPDPQLDADGQTIDLDESNDHMT